MNVKVTLDVGSRYTGCRELIPGTVYTDQKGEQLLFIGYSHVVRDEGTGYYWGNFDAFVYAKVKQIQAKIDKGLLSADLHHYYGEDIEATSLFYTPSKARILKKAEYVMFPSDYFVDFKITQHYKSVSGECECKITTRPLVNPYVCRVEIT